MKQKNKGKLHYEAKQHKQICLAFTYEYYGGKVYFMWHRVF